MTKDNIAEIWLTDEAIFIRTKDGKNGFERFTDYLPLKKATQTERENYRISVYGIHWDDLDEDLCFDGFFKNKISA